VKTLIIIGDGSGAGALWDKATPGCDLEEGRLELDGKVERVFRLSRPWGTAQGARVLEVLMVREHVRAEQLARCEGVERVLSGAAAKLRAAQGLFAWPTQVGAQGLEEVPLPGISGGHAPAVLDDGSSAEVYLSGGKLERVPASELGIELPDAAAEVAGERVP